MNSPNERELAAATERIRQYIGGKDLYAVYAGATADDDQRYFEEDIDTVLAALASAQRDAAQLERAKGLIREAMRHGVNGSDGYDARNANETGQDMRIFLLNNTTP